MKFYCYIKIRFCDLFTLRTSDLISTLTYILWTTVVLVFTLPSKYKFWLNSSIRYSLQNNVNFFNYKYFCLLINLFEVYSHRIKYFQNLFSKHICTKLIPATISMSYTWVQIIIFVINKVLLITCFEDLN